MKLITPSALVERLKINGSLARAACKYLLEEGKISKIETPTLSLSIPELLLFKSQHML